MMDELWREEEKKTLESIAKLTRIGKSQMGMRRIQSAVFHE